MDFLAGNTWEHFNLALVAEKTSLPLGQVFQVFPEKDMILLSLFHELDQKHLSSLETSPESLPSKDTLFEFFMVRFDLMNDKRDFFRNAHKIWRENPRLGLRRAAFLRRFFQQIFDLISLNTQDILGEIRLQGLLYCYYQMVSTWENDPSEGLEATMAKVDEYLAHFLHYGGVNQEV